MTVLNVMMTCGIFEELNLMLWYSSFFCLMLQLFFSDVAFHYNGVALHNTVVLHYIVQRCCSK